MNPLRPKSLTARENPHIDATNSWVEIIKAWVRSCAYCGCGFGWTPFFCSVCREKLSDYFLLPKDLKLKEETLDCFALLDWQAHNDHLLTSLAYGLKNGGVPQMYLELAQEFSWRRQSYGRSPKEGWVLVPAPAHTAKQQDHAWHWAQALSGLWGFTVQPCLAHKRSWWVHMSQKWMTTAGWKPKTQKSLKREERRYIELIQTSHDLKSQKIIFVDDILTTGATAYAAWYALGRPEHFEIWTILRRPVTPRL